MSTNVVNRSIFIPCSFYFSVILFFINLDRYYSHGDMHYTPVLFLSIM